MFNCDDAERQESAFLLDNQRLSDKFNARTQTQFRNEKFSMQERVSVINDEGTKSKRNVAAMFLIAVASVCWCLTFVSFKLILNVGSLFSSSNKMNNISMLALFESFSVSLSMTHFAQIMILVELLRAIISVLGWQIMRQTSSLELTNSRVWYGNDRKCFAKLLMYGFLQWLLIFSSFISARHLNNTGLFISALFCSAPLCCIVVAVLCFKEKMGNSSLRLYLLSLVLMIIGVILVCQPSTAVLVTHFQEMRFSWLMAVLFLVIAILSWTLVCVLLKSSSVDTSDVLNTDTVQPIHWLQFEISSSLVAVLSWFVWLIAEHVSRLGLSFSFSSILSVFASVFSLFGWRLLVISIGVMSLFMFVGVLCAVLGFQIGDMIKISSMQYFCMILLFGFTIVQFAMQAADAQSVWLSLSSSHMFWSMIGMLCVSIGVTVHITIEWKYAQNLRKQAQNIQEKYDALQQLSSNDGIFYYQSAFSDIGMTDSEKNAQLNGRLTIFQ